MSDTLEIGSLIVSSDNIRGGRPRIAGTGVTVQRIVRLYQLGMTPDEIADRIEHLNLAQVYAALAHYHANREEMEREITADDAAADQAQYDASNRATS